MNETDQKPKTSVEEDLAHEGSTMKKEMTFWIGLMNFLGHILVLIQDQFETNLLKAYLS